MAFRRLFFLFVWCELVAYSRVAGKGWTGPDTFGKLGTCLPRPFVFEPDRVQQLR